MPATKNKKSKPSNPRPVLRRKLFWFGVVALLIALAGLVTPTVLRYQKTKAIAADRIRFEQADRDVQSVADAIVAAVGQPYAVKENKSCSYRSVKFEKVPPLCSTSRYLFYGVDDSVQANRITDKVKPAAAVFWQYRNTEGSNSSNVFEQYSPLDIKDYARLNDYQSILFRFKGKNMNMNCSITSDFYPSFKPPYIEYESSNKQFTLALSSRCSDIAKGEFFRIRQ